MGTYLTFPIMRRILHLMLVYVLLINGLSLYAQTSTPTIEVTNEESYEVIKIVKEYHCPYDISDNKKHAVIQAWGEGSSYYWSAETGVIAFNGCGYAISDEGVIAGWYTNEEGYNVAGLWHPDTQEWEFLGMNPDVPEFADIDYNSAWTMSNDGKKIGVMQFDAAWNTFSYVWSKEDGYVKITNGPSTVTRPQGMSSDGSVIAGFYVDDMGYRAPCYWAEDEFFPISSYLGESWNVSPNGRYICGNVKNSQGNAFIYDIESQELILIDNTLADCAGSMTALCVTDDGNAFGYICTGDPADYLLRRGFAYIDGELMLFDDYLMINGVDEADNWKTYCVNSVTPDGKTFLGAAKMKGQDYTFIVTIADKACDAPSNLTYTIDENNHRNITLNWDAPENPVDVTYEIYTSYTAIDPIYQGITETSFTIENMDAGYYRFVVKANWGGTCLSNPSNAVKPTIYPCDTDDMCEITFKMLDGYGDGWNGAYIEIIPENSTFSYSVGLEKEGLDTVVKTVSVCPDDYTFLWHYGEFDEEISFSILFDGAEIYKADTGTIDYMFELNFLNYGIYCGGTNIIDIEENPSVNIYPNPVNDRLYIMTQTTTQTMTQTTTIEIYDVYGRRQRTTVNGQQSSSIDISDLNSGVYFVKIYTDNGNFVKRIIKQ